jgi:serine protease Do
MHLKLWRQFSIAGALIALMLPRFALAEFDGALLAAVAPSLVKIRASDSSGKQALGTGVVVGRGKVITNCHVTLDATRIELAQDRATWEANAEASDVKRDLCLLKVSGLDLPAVKLGSVRDLKLNQDVRAAGFALGSELHFVAGAVSGLHRYEASYVIQTTTRFLPGDSGGALFDNSGRLVGILTFYFDQGGVQRHFAIPADWVERCLAAGERYRPIAPLVGERPFWQYKLTELPYFMRAVALEARGRWGELTELAKDWAAAEPNSTEAALVREAAQRRLESRDAGPKAQIGKLGTEEKAL